MGGEAHHEVTRLVDVIVRYLPGWMEDYPGGPTIKQVAEMTGIGPGQVRMAFWELRGSERATVYQSSEDHALHVAPLSYEPPSPVELSRNQKKVLGYLQRLHPDADGTVTPPSSVALHKGTGVPTGSLGAVVGDLERKGELEIVQRGAGPLQKPKYRVSHRQVLQQAIAERDALARNGGVRDVSHLSFDDPSPNRRTPA